MKNTLRGSYLQRKRQGAGIRQEDLAKMLDISIPSLCAYENGKDMKVSMFISICEKLDIPKEEWAKVMVM